MSALDDYSLFLCKLNSKENNRGSTSDLFVPSSAVPRQFYRFFIFLGAKTAACGGPRFLDINQKHYNPRRNVHVKKLKLVCRGEMCVATDHNNHGHLRRVTCYILI